MGKKLALLIGVTQYGKEMSPLPAAKNDVKAMQQILEVDGYEVTRIIDPNSSEEMATAIQNLFAKERNKADFLLLFFSGHGMTDDNGNFFLTTKNTPKQNFQPKAVPATSVQYFMSNCPARQQVVILNCCYSGAFAKNWQPKHYHHWALLASSSSMEISLTDDELSIYTRYLIEGIQTGAADSNKDGIILVHELHDYIKEKVQKVTDNKMTPHFQGVGEYHKIQLAKASTKVEYDRIWECVHTLTDHSQKVNCIAISPDDRTFVSGSADRTIKIWDFWNGKLIDTLSGHSDAVNSIAISPDGKTLVSGSCDRTIKIWNRSDRKIIRTLGGNLFYEDLDVVNSVAITPDGKTLLAGGLNHKVKQWNLEKGNYINEISEQNLGVYSIAVSPDGKKVATDSQGDKIKLFNLESKELLQIFSGHCGSIWSIAISPNGEMLASGSEDRTINVWNLETGELLDTFNGHSKPVHCVNFSFDSQTVISGSYDRTIKLWDIKTGNLIRTLTDEYLSCVNSVAFNRNGRSILSGSDDGKIKIWK